MDTESNTIIDDAETRYLLLASLKGRTCPGCRGEKSPRMSVCGNCWKRLPPSVQHGLYSRLDDGYAEAFGVAMAVLSVPRDELPDRLRPPPRPHDRAAYPVRPPCIEFQRSS